MKIKFIKKGANIEILPICNKILPKNEMQFISIGQNIRVDVVSPTMVTIRCTINDRYRKISHIAFISTNTLLDILL